MTAFSVVPIDSSTDFQAWTDLFRAYVVHTHDKDILPVEQYRQTFDRLVDPKGDLHGFMLMSSSDDDDNAPTSGPAGFVIHLFHATAWNQQGHCYLAELWVDPAHRRKGGARLLIEAVRKDASDKGNWELYWHTKIDNKVARGLYDQLAKNEQTVYEMVL